MSAITTDRTRGSYANPAEEFPERHGCGCLCHEAGWAFFGPACPYCLRDCREAASKVDSRCPLCRGARLIRADDHHDEFNSRGLPKLGWMPCPKCSLDIWEQHKQFVQAAARAVDFAVQRARWAERNELRERIKEELRRWHEAPCWDDVREEPAWLEEWEGFRRAMWRIVDGLP